MLNKKGTQQGTSIEVCEEADDFVEAIVLWLGCWLSLEADPDPAARLSTTVQLGAGAKDPEKTSAAYPRALQSARQNVYMQYELQTNICLIYDI